jgi:hypothetical protein
MVRTQVRIKLSVLIPVDGPKETVRGRRERFRTAIEKAMNAIGWELIAIIPALKFKKSGPKAAGELSLQATGMNAKGSRPL